MIEVTLLNYLNSAGLSAPVYAEQPKDKPAVFFVIEKSGSSRVNQIDESDFIVQSYAPTKYLAASMNEEIKEVMFGARFLDEVSAVELNSDYDYTDTDSKTYRYQAVYVITHY